MEQYHCDPESWDWDDDTPLHEACRWGHLDVVRYLVSEGGCCTACWNKHGQARRLGGFGGFGRTAHTQAKVRGAEADEDLSKISSADTIYVVAYRLA